MTTHIVQGKEITDWDSFHNFFAKEFDFPDYYGRNMNAWIDCMGDVGENQITTLLIHNVNFLRERNREIYDSLIECSAFVNWRYVSEDGQPALALAFYD